MILFYIHNVVFYLIYWLIYVTKKIVLAKKWRICNERTKRGNSKWIRYVFKALKLFFARSSFFQVPSACLEVRFSLFKNIYRKKLYKYQYLYFCFLSVINLFFINNQVFQSDFWCRQFNFQVEVCRDGEPNFLQKTKMTLQLLFLFKIRLVFS